MTKKKCDCGPNEGCSLCCKAPMMILKDLKPTKKVKTVKKKTDIISAKEFVAGITAPFPYKRSDLDVIVTLGVGKSKMVPRVTVRLIKKNDYKKCLWEGNSTVAEVESFNDDEALMAFVKAKVGVVVPVEISYDFKEVNSGLIGLNNKLNLTLDTEESYFTLRMFSKTGNKVVWKERLCADGYDGSDTDIKDLVERLWSDPSDGVAKAFLRAAFDCEENEILASKGGMASLFKALKKFSVKNKDSALSAVVSETDPLVMRYIAGRIMDLTDGMGDQITLARTPLSIAVVPFFLMTDLSMRKWLNRDSIVDLIQVVIMAFGDPAYTKVEVKKNQDILALVSKKEAANVFFAVDDLIVIREVSEDNQVLTMDSVIERVNNGRF